MLFILCVILAYVLGSLSSALLAARFLKLPDPRTQGSGNAGATNILRLAGKEAGLAVLLGDLFKGLLAILIARLFGVHNTALAFVGLAVVIGHIFPIFYQFKGGKGVATGLGVLLGLNFWVGLFVIATWVIFAFAFRYASLASITAFVAAPIYLLITGHANYFLPVLFISILIIWKHWENIERLKLGTENKLQF